MSLAVSSEAIFAIVGTLVAALIGAYATVRAANIAAGNRRTRLLTARRFLRFVGSNPLLLPLTVGTVFAVSWFATPRLAGVTLRASQPGDGQYKAIMQAYRTLAQNGDHPYRIRFEDVKSGGSAETLEQISGDESDIGLVQANGAPTTSNLTAMARVYEEYYFFVSDPDLPPRDVRSLRAGLGDEPMRIATLGANSQTHQDLVRLLKILKYSSNEYEIENFEQNGYERALDKVAEDDKIHFGFFVTGLANEKLVAALRDDRCRLVDISGNEALAMELPGTVAREVPPFFLGNAEAYETISTSAILACSRKLSNSLVYELTRALFEDRGLLGKQFGQKLSIEPPGDSRVMFPVHPGAEQYYNRESPGFLTRNQYWISTIVGLLSIAATFAAAARSRAAERRGGGDLPAFNLPNGAPGGPSTPSGSPAAAGAPDTVNHNEHDQRATKAQEAVHDSL